jgi:hypothetical protein
MHQGTSPSWLGMTDHGQFSRPAVLRALQEQESFVYTILTREGAIKVGVTTNLADRMRGIKFGGTRKLMGFIPGDIRLERDIQASVAEHLIPGTREYFYPMKPLLQKANWMRDYWGIEPLPGAYLPRLAECTFHRRVMEARSRGTSVFSD